MSHIDIEKIEKARIKSQLKTNTSKTDIENKTEANQKNLAQSHTLSNKSLSPEPLQIQEINNS